MNFGERKEKGWNMPKTQDSLTNSTVSIAKPSVVASYRRTKPLQI